MEYDCGRTQGLFKNAWCDRISAKLLKDAAPIIAPSLATLFNRSLNSGFSLALEKSGESRHFISKVIGQISIIIGQ